MLATIDPLKKMWLLKRLEGILLEARYISGTFYFIVKRLVGIVLPVVSIIDLSVGDSNLIAITK